MLIKLLMMKFHHFKRKRPQKCGSFTTYSIVYLVPIEKYSTLKIVNSEKFVFSLSFYISPAGKTRTLINFYGTPIKCGIIYILNRHTVRRIEKEIVVIDDT